MVAWSRSRLVPRSMPPDSPSNPVTRRIRSPFGARASLVVLVVAVLGLIAGGTLVAQISDQMRDDANGRLDSRADAATADVASIISTASSDLRLARRNAVFDQALSDTPGQLLPRDRVQVEAAITYLGERYAVDEICLIRADGLETARWVHGAGVAALADLSPDERQNNPAVLPTLQLADDEVDQTAPYISPDSKRWVIGMATPIVLANGTTAGVLHFEIPIERFAQQLASTDFDDTGYTVLLDHGGRLLVHPDLATFRAAANLSTDEETAPFPLATAAGSPSWRDAVGLMRSTTSGATTFTDQGETYRISFRAVPGSDRIFGMVVPTAALYADVDRMLFNLGATVIPLLALVVVITGWFTRRMAVANRGLSGLNERLAAANARLEDSGRTSSDLARESAVVNQFTELAALTEDDVSLSEATLATLDELARPTGGTLHVSNQSQDRAVTQATLGGREGEVLALHELGRCPAIRRSSLYVTDDLSSRLAYRCPVYNAQSGTLACVPLVALGETVGAVHLHWAEPRELPLPLRLAIMRVSEHSALSIANRRLLLALRGQANTDGRTGLTNSRAFDQAVERRLALRAAESRAAVLMLDLDHFKEFNDRYGHPAGDEALRVFAGLVRSSIREGDIAARYGGEEFAIYLHDLDGSAVGEIAERIRERTETTIIPLGPGQTGRLTVSIGIAVAPDDGIDRVTLLRAADDALYQAKLSGRNRVVGNGLTARRDDRRDAKRRAAAS